MITPNVVFIIFSSKLSQQSKLSNWGSRGTAQRAVISAGTELQKYWDQRPDSTSPAVHSGPVGVTNIIKQEWLLGSWWAHLLTWPSVNLFCYRPPSVTRVECSHCKRFKASPPGELLHWAVLFWNTETSEMYQNILIHCCLLSLPHKVGQVTIECFKKWDRKNIPILNLTKKTFLVQHYYL